MPWIEQRELSPGEWTTLNPILLKGELGWESGATPKAKKGDGVTAWNDLPYAIAPLPDTSGFAPLDSPLFTGDPKAPTPATGDNDSSIATTAFVKAQGYAVGADVTDAINEIIDGAPVTLNTLNKLAAALNDDPNFANVITAAVGLKAPTASPTFTGDPKAPTPANNDSDTSIATTGYVVNMLKQSVANVAALPVTAAYRGQRIYVEDLDVFAWWDDKTSAWQGFRRTYTPTIVGTSSPTVVAEYVIEETGKVTVRYLITFAGAASATVSMSVPVAMRSTYSALDTIGGSMMRDNSTSARVAGFAVPGSQTIVNFYFSTGTSTAAGAVGAASTPWVWAANDTVSGVLTYFRDGS